MKFEQIIAWYKEPRRGEGIQDVLKHQPHLWHSSREDLIASRIQEREIMVIKNTEIAPAKNKRKKELQLIKFNN